MQASWVFANLPNMITIARLVMAPLAIQMILLLRFQEAFYIFLLAGVSDGVDGFLAKRFDLTSELGAYLDPLADKALLVSVYVTLAAMGYFSPAIAILVVSRDLMIMTAVIVSWLMRKPVKIAPVWMSKANTVAQISLAGLTLASLGFNLKADFALWALGFLVAGSTLTSGAVYIAQWLRHMSR